MTSHFYRLTAEGLSESHVALFVMLAIIFSSFAVFASILVDIVCRSFMRFLSLCDDAFDFNTVHMLNYELGQ